LKCGFGVKLCESAIWIIRYENNIILMT
jgi:hypothetical protein